MLACTTVPAQRVTPVSDNPVAKAFADSLAELSASYFAYFRLWDDLTVPSPKGIRLDPAYYKLIVPPTYYEAPIRQAFALNWEPGTSVPTAIDTLYMGKRRDAEVFRPGNLETYAKVDRWVNAILKDFYLQHPEQVVNNEVFWADIKPLETDRVMKKSKKEKMSDYMHTKAPVKDLNAETELVVVRPNFWTKNGNASLQLTQNYISSNWYNGGESTSSMLSNLTWEANYDDRQRVEFENKLELKLGFVTAPSDTVHHFKTNTDLFRLYSKLGVKAVKNWYYTLAGEFKSQFFASYNTNTNEMVSNFLSPAELDVTLGLDFKQNKKKYTLSLLTSPLAYTLMYIHNDQIIDTEAFNVPAGHKSANLLGSKFTGNLTWTIIPSITWESKLEYFTTYSTVIASWENTFNFTLNRFLSTKLFVHARYDDGVTLTEDNRSYFQLQELLSFGLNYTW